MLDVPWHPITRRIAVGQGFEQHKNNPSVLIKIALGLPVTDRTWGKIRLSVERLSGLGLQSKCPNYRTPIVSLTAPDGEIKEVGLFELETLLSPTIFILPSRDAVIVPITRTFAADLLGTDLQYSLLEKPEAQFLFRRTYFNSPRSAYTMTRGKIIVFYELSRGHGRSAVVALGRVVDATSIPVESMPEVLRRRGVVEKPEALTKSKRILATTFDNLIALRRPVTLDELRAIGCVPGSNFVSATPVSISHLKAIVDAGWADE